MPMITAETPREDFTIAKQTFSGAHPYAAGHTLTEGEARALNQTFIENIRNNKAKAVKDHLAAGSFDQAAMQSEIDDYMSSYEFGVRIAAGSRAARTPRDAVLTRAVELARAKVRQALVKAGVALKDVSAKDITERARKAVEDNPRYRELAAQQLAEEEGLEVDVPGMDSPATSKGKSQKAA